MSDPFEQLNDLGTCSDSVEEKLRNCRFTTGLPDSVSSEEESPLPDETPVESTGIIMQSLPDSPIDEEEPTLEEDFQTPEENLTMTSVVSEKELRNHGGSVDDGTIDIGKDTDVLFSDVKSYSEKEFLETEIIDDYDDTVGDGFGDLVGEVRECEVLKSGSKGESPLGDGLGFSEARKYDLGQSTIEIRENCEKDLNLNDSVDAKKHRESSLEKILALLKSKDDGACTSVTKSPEDTLMVETEKSVEDTLMVETENLDDSSVRSNATERTSPAVHPNVLGEQIFKEISQFKANEEDTGNVIINNRAEEAENSHQNKRGGRETGGSRAVSFENSPQLITDYHDIVDVLCTPTNQSEVDEDVDILETAIKAGMKFPRPRWW